MDARPAGLIMAVLIASTPAYAADEMKPAAPPLTQTSALGKGPQRIGNLPAVPVPPGNPQSTRKIRLGKLLYFDTRLSKDNTISCATCHDPLHGWSDEGPISKGVGGALGNRRSPPVSNAAYFPLQFWDGRVISLEDQAKGPIENPVEMANTHAAVVATLSGVPTYVEEFKAVFGAGPITIDQVVEAIAAFERTVVTTDSPFDRYMKGDLAALTPAQVRGLEVFNGRGHCTACHWGPNLTDGGFHNVGVRPKDPAKPDLGRFEVTKRSADRGAFKTPSMRDVGKRAPYLHDGSARTLEDTIAIYNRGGDVRGRHLDPLIVPLGLSRHDIADLAAFLRDGLASLNPEVASVQPPAAADMPR